MHYTLAHRFLKLILCECILITSFIYRSSEKVFGTHGLCPRSFFKIVMPFGILWSATNYSYLRALGKIAATDVTALFSSCNAFVYIFSLLLLHEPFLIFRVRIVSCDNPTISFLYWFFLAVITFLDIKHSDNQGRREAEQAPGLCNCTMPLGGFRAKC